MSKQASYSVPGFIALADDRFITKLESSLDSKIAKLASSIDTVSEALAWLALEKLTGKAYDEVVACIAAGLGNAMQSVMVARCVEKYGMSYKDEADSRIDWGDYYTGSKKCIRLVVRQAMRHQKKQVLFKLDLTIAVSQQEASRTGVERLIQSCNKEVDETMVKLK